MSVALKGDPSDSIIEIKALTRVYGSGELAVRALDNIDLEIKSGEFVVLLGPSGSGKTTLLNMIGGIDQPTSGKILVNGKSIEKLKRQEMTEFRRSHVAFVFQFFNLIPTLSASENVQLIADLTGGDKEYTEKALTDVGLGEHLNRFPSQLSGGQQQRVAIARAIAKNSPVLLCDEPTGSLDRKSGETVLKLIKKINQEKGTTVVMVTHDPSTSSLADRVINMVDGEIDSDQLTSSTS